MNTRDPRSETSLDQTRDQSIAITHHASAGAHCHQSVPPHLALSSIDPGLRSVHSSHRTCHMRKESAGEQRAGANGRAPTRVTSIRAAASKLSHRSSIRSACLCGGALPAWAWVSLRKRSARVGARASHRCLWTSAHPLAEHSSCCIEAQPPTRQCSTCPWRPCGIASDLVETVRMLCAGCPARIVPVVWDERTACGRSFEPRRPSPVPRARGGVAAISGRVYTGHHSARTRIRSYTTLMTVSSTTPCAYIGRPHAYASPPNHATQIPPCH